MSSYDVIVVGGGIIGGAIAFRLAQKNIRVALLDSSTPGREASWAAAGMLSPAPDSPDSIPLVPLGRASLRLYPGFISELQELTGTTIGYRAEGTIEVLFSTDAERELSTLIALHHGLGLSAEPLPIAEARRLEPGLGREARAAALLPDECCVDNRVLTGAVLAAGRAAGVELFPDTPATRILKDGSRCVGVFAGGREHSAGQVVLAAGAFCGAIDGVNAAVSVRPVRGQMVALRNYGARLRRVLRADHGYVVPRDDASPQRLVAGSTLEDAGFAKCVTPRGLEQIFSSVQELAPALAAAEVVDTWSGLRPGTPDSLPLLGPAELDGLTFATGHFRNGILLAPVTAKLVCEWITERTVSIDWDRFSPLRFGAVAGAESKPPSPATAAG
jgi:glycine oxidase